MTGTDFGIGGAIKLLMWLLVMTPLLALAGIVVVICWLCGVEPRAWMGWTAGGVFVVAAFVMSHLLRD